jgi:hypothetical protein
MRNIEISSLDPHPRRRIRVLDTEIIVSRDRRGFWSPNQISTGDEKGNIIDRFQNIVFETALKQKRYDYTC